MKDIYSELIIYKGAGNPAAVWQRIEEMNIRYLFSPLAQYYGDNERVNKALFYILQCYSRTSKVIIKDASWGDIKALVLADLKITDADLVDDLVNLKPIEVQEVVERYLDFQASRTFRHLQMLRDLYDQLCTSAGGGLMNKDDKMDFDQKKKNADYAKELYEEIYAWEQRLNEEEATVKEQRKELVKKRPKKKTGSLRIEDVLAEMGEEQNKDIKAE